jgi:hypothetical protein
MKSSRSLAAALLCLAMTAGCRQDMHNQPKYIPLRHSEFFKDGSSARPLPEDTVARGTLQDDSAFFTGKNGSALVDTLPFPLTQQVLDRGENRFDIYCAPCHDRNGTGNGMIVRLPPAAVVPHRSAAAGATRPLLRRDDERVRRDAGLPRADRAA